MVWTNAVGAAFTATLLSVSDGGATFVFPETGETNRIAWTQLSAATATRIQLERDFIPLPPAIAATWTRAKTELQRADDLLADGRMTSSDHTRRCNAIFRAFGKICVQKGMSSDVIRRLKNRLLVSRR